MENRVGFAPRAGAYLIDVLILATVTYVLQLAVFTQQRMPTTYGEQLQSTGNLASFVFFTLYILIEGRLGASPGKMALGLRIGDEEGREETPGVYLFRSALKNLGVLIFFLAALSFFVADGLGRIVMSAGYLAALVMFCGYFLALRDHRQALHDKLTHTAVYRKSDIIPLE